MLLATCSSIKNEGEHRVWNGRVVELIVGGADIARGETVVRYVLKLVTRKGDLEQDQRNNSDKRRQAPLEFRMVDCWRGLAHGSNIMRVRLQLQ